MDTIKSSQEITRIFNLGKRYGRRPANLLVLEREEHGLPGRVAFIAGKKWGNAVWRNRAKRRMRAACHEVGGPWEGFDVVFIAGKETADIPFDELLDAYRQAIRRMERDRKSRGGNTGEAQQETQNCMPRTISGKLDNPTERPASHKTNTALGITPSGE